MSKKSKRYDAAVADIVNEAERSAVRGRYCTL
jgi:hypothetical protein